MELKKLKQFLKANNITLYDSQYRILNSLIKNKKQVGGSYQNYYQSVLGINYSEINYNINKILNYKTKKN